MDLGFSPTQTELKLFARLSQEAHSLNGSSDISWLKIIQNVSFSAKPIIDLPV